MAVCAVTVFHWCSLKALTISYKPECLYSANNISEAHGRTLPNSLGHRLLIEQSKWHWDLTMGLNWGFQNSSREANGLMKLGTIAQETGSTWRWLNVLLRDGCKFCLEYFRCFLFRILEINIWDLFFLLNCFDLRNSSNFSCVKERKH